jgi:hypothetical protein
VPLQRWQRGRRQGLPCRHANHLSQRDFEICLGFDVESIADRSGIDAMPELHAALVEKYKVEDATTPG